jgi:plasmid replication initiation protein
MATIHPLQREFDLFADDRLDSNAKVTMSNRLARAAQQLSLFELRVVYLALTKTNSFPGRTSALALHKNEGWAVSLTADEYAEAFNLTRKAAYAQLSGVVDGLMQKKVQRVLSRSTTGQQTHEAFLWVQYARYDETKACVDILFSAPITPHLLGLKDHFTLFLLRHMAGLDSGYAITLYRNLRSWIDVGRWTPTLEEFWEAMEVPEGSYRRDFRNLRLRVIEPAVASINVKTDLNVQWRPMFRGERKVTGLDFRFIESANKALELPPPFED